MINIPKAIIIFVSASLFGYLMEQIFFHKKKRHDRLIKKIFDITPPMLSIYGLAAVMLWMALKNIKLNNIHGIFIFSLISTVIATFLECLIGIFSQKMFGGQGWNYKSSLCKGYISISISMTWFIIIFTIANIYYTIK